MENRLPDTAPQGEGRGDVRATYGHDESDASVPDLDEIGSARVEMQRIDSLRIPVGTNLADAERWMIFATLQKCGGNKTRAAEPEDALQPPQRLSRAGSLHGL